MTHLDFSFQKRRFQGFIRYKILIMARLMRENFFSYLPLDKHFKNFQTFYVYSCRPSKKVGNLNYVSTRGGGGHLNVT